MSSRSDVFWRMTLLVASGSALLIIFLFQRLDLASKLWSDLSSINTFIINKAVRYILNDLFMIVLIYAVFVKRKYVLFAFYVQLFGVVFFLVPYFILKFNFPSYNGPLVSFLHRLVVNPLLMLLLIPAFFYQQKLEKNKH